jgi:L-aminopeptidase/D-esterase-like protein
MVTPGATNTLTDVAGIGVGHATRLGEGWLTGTTVIVAPSGGAVGGVDVRGGGPGTRETDLLDPRNAVTHVHAVVLTGGSAFGLAAADGVMKRLFAAGVGFPVGGPGEVVPIVPCAVIFDLGRGGGFDQVPDASLGAEAYDAASVGPVPLGVVGAGTGAVAGGLKGGVGSASAVLDFGVTVAALVVVNAVGSTVDPTTGELYAVRTGLADEFAGIRTPDPAQVAAWQEAVAAGSPPLATTLAVIATDATLTKAQCAKVSGIGHDGMARAIRPVHTMFDGDTVFTLATGAQAAPDAMAFYSLIDAAGDCVTRAIAHAMLAADTTETAKGSVKSYRDAFGSAVR